MQLDPLDRISCARPTKDHTMIDPHYFEELDLLIDTDRRRHDERLADDSLSCNQCGRYVQGIAHLVDHVEHCTQ